MTTTRSATPPVVPRHEWQRNLDDLLVEEKRLTRALDALAARRRRLPMVAMGDYTFAGPDGPLTLDDLFQGRGQLIVYQFMNTGPDSLCPGCVTMMDNVPHLDHLNRRDISWHMVSNIPIERLTGLAARFGWLFPYASSAGTTFSADCGAGDGFGLSAFLRTPGGVHQTYFTTSRGADRFRFDFSMMDIAPFGRGETWEDSPEGWPQTPPYEWWRPRDE
ncbi:DUF899 family protein [Kineosporia sp. J2-2]|uniref:DUF899 family protein n=1 Tax=Kineosporia corallincola TaxID=2835133 RepID=A0ABS5TCL4_9ACTN|nr:DUF899 family protein [Kineosporia corallincola]MBT0768829.1 DUF899 family protein [Kineosporia corallincola]